MGDVFDWKKVTGLGEFSSDIQNRKCAAGGINLKTFIMVFVSNNPLHITIVPGSRTANDFALVISSDQKILY